MKIIAQCLLFFSLGQLATSTESSGYLRRRAKALKSDSTLQPQFKSVKPLFLDAIQLSPDTHLGPGITLSTSAISSSDSIDVSFTISPEYYVDGRVAPNAKHIDEWSVGIYMHMSDPQGGALPPIVSLRPHFDGRGDREGSVTFGKETVNEMEGTDPSWPLDTLAYGNGFDVWVLDENGGAVVGPEWFTLTSLEVSSSIGAIHHPLAAHGHANVKQDFSEDDAAVTQEYVSSFALSTDKMYYASTDKIQVSYTIGEESTPVNADRDSLILFDPPSIQDEMPLHMMDAQQGMEHQSLFDHASFQSKDAIDADFIPQQQVVVNPSKQSSYTIAIYMKMARPQNGKLQPILSSRAVLESGTVSFDASLLDTLQYGTGFDVWIIDEKGAEVYGPVFFGIPDPEDEDSPVLTSY